MTPLKAKERGLAILPNERLAAEKFVALLKANGVKLRIVGRGKSDVTGNGLLLKVGVVVIGVDETDVNKAMLHAKLCGMKVVKIEDVSSMEVKDDDGG